MGQFNFIGWAERLSYSMPVRKHGMLLDDKISNYKSKLLGRLLIYSIDEKMLNKPDRKMHFFTKLLGKVKSIIDNDPKYSK